MIDRQEFYHGAALIRVVEDKRCQAIVKSDLGFIVNHTIFVYLKYTTKGRSPWRFQFGNEEIAYLDSIAERRTKIVIAFICGGDGICGITWSLVSVLVGHATGWVSCERKFNKQYGVAGSREKLKGKVALQLWPNLIFEDLP